MAQSELVGKVVSDKMTKTVVVLVERLVAHPLYKKRFKQSRKIKAHNEIGVKIGDWVRIVETKPISKEKSFVVAEVLK